MTPVTCVYKRCMYVGNLWDELHRNMDFREKLWLILHEMLCFFSLMAMMGMWWTCLRNTLSCYGGPQGTNVLVSIVQRAEAWPPLQWMQFEPTKQMPASLYLPNESQEQVRALSGHLSPISLHFRAWRCKNGNIQLLPWKVGPLAKGSLPPPLGKVSTHVYSVRDQTYGSFSLAFLYCPPFTRCRAFFGCY